MKKFIGVLFLILLFSTSAIAKPPQKNKNVRSKFYDFNEQLIDGEVKKPTTLYLNSREKVKFDRLMKLKKSFLPKLFSTAKEKVFK